MASKYEVPNFLKDKILQEIYTKWLTSKAKAQHTRDKKRWGIKHSYSDYKKAIHKAIIESRGQDFYTKEKLHWHLLGKYNNKAAKQNGLNYKKQFALLPTLDHYDPQLKNTNFVICSWRTNDAKNDLSHQEFVKLCQLVVAKSKKKPSR